MIEDNKDDYDDFSYLDELTEEDDLIEEDKGLEKNINDLSEIIETFGLMLLMIISFIVFSPFFLVYVLFSSSVFLVRALFKAIKRQGI